MQKYNIITDNQKRKYKHLLDSNISYNAKTPDFLIEILEKLRQNRTRIRVYFGDTTTGANWDELFNIKGRIGNSSGEIKIPLLVYNKRSLGGGALLTNCIVKIESTQKPYTVYYQHPKYHKEDC